MALMLTVPGLKQSQGAKELLAVKNQYCHFQGAAGFSVSK